MKSSIAVLLGVLIATSCAPTAGTTGSSAASPRSQTPTQPTAATGTGATTARPNAAVLKPNFGVIYWGTEQGFEPALAPKIRREGETTTLAQLAGEFFNQFHGAVAPSGRRAVYRAEPTNGLWTLYLLDGAKPTEQRKLLELPGEIPTEIMWSGDETAVAFTVEDAGAVQGVPPKYDAIRALDLATGRVSEVARISSGSYYRLVGWDGATGTIAWIEPNGAAGSYVIRDSSGTRSTRLDAAWTMLASPDARTVIGFRCDGQGTNCAAWAWPIGNLAARADQHLGTGLAVAPIAWRPGSDDIGLLVGTPAASSAHLLMPDHVELWSPTKGRRTIHSFVNGNTPPGPCFFRADGSAFFVPGYGTAVVVDLASGATSALPFPVATGPYDKPFPSASIRLEGP